jgi:hypothetical protein
MNLPFPQKIVYYFTWYFMNAVRFNNDDNN